MEAIPILELALGLATGAVIPLILWMRDSRKRAAEEARSQEQWANELAEAKRREVEAERRAAEFSLLQAEADRREIEWKRRETEWKQQDEQWEYQESKQRHDELAAAFDIHADLSQLQVFEALAHSREDEAARQFAIQLHARASYRFKSFSDDYALPDNVVELVTAALGKINDALPDETKSAQRVFTEKVATKQDHAKSNEVQARIREFAARLVGRPVEKNDSSEVLAEFRDVAESVRVSRGGQGVEIVLPGGLYKMWFAGNGKGEIPSEITHFDAKGKGCTLASSKVGALKSRLAPHAASGDALAEAFVGELRGLAKSGVDCGCGVPFALEAASVPAV